MKRFEAMLLHEGSTRPAALMRVGLALLVWVRFAADIAPWATPRMHPVPVALFFVASTAMLVGFYSRTASALTGAILLWMVYGIGPRSVEPWTHHHTTLLAHGTALLALTPCGGSYSVDRWLALGRGTAGPERGPSWGTTLIAVQMTVLYLSAALDKCTPAFLSGERLQHTYMMIYQGADPVAWPGFTAVMAIGAWAVVIVEFALPVGMWFRRLQPPLILAGIAMHAVFWLALPVGTFTLTSLLLYLAWLDPDEVHGVIDRLAPAAPLDG